MGGFYLDLELLAVDLGHTLHFSEGNNVSIIHSVFLLLVQADKASLLLGDASNMHRLALFTSAIDDAVALSEIDEGEAVEPQVASVDEAQVFGVDCLGQLEQVITVVVIKYNNTFVVTDSE